MTTTRAELPALIAELRRENEALQEEIEQLRYALLLWTEVASRLSEALRRASRGGA